MTLSTRIAAYGDCIKLFEAALDDPVGAKAKFKTRSEAHYFSMRMQQARTLLQQESAREYPRSDPRYGRCEFDCFMVRVKYDEEDDNYWVSAERANPNLQIETIGAE